MLIPFLCLLAHSDACFAWWSLILAESNADLLWSDDNCINFFRLWDWYNCCLWPGQWQLPFSPILALFLKVFQFSAVKWLKYCRYGVKSHFNQWTNQFNQAINQNLVMDLVWAHCPQNLSTIPAKYGHRCIAFKNRAPRRVRDDQVEILINMIDGIISQNHWRFYRNEMYSDAEKIT